MDRILVANELEHTKFLLSTGKRISVQKGFFAALPGFLILPLYDANFQ